MNNKFKSKELIEKELAWFHDWSGGTATRSMFEHSNVSTSQGKEAAFHNRYKYMSDQESMAALGRSSTNTIVCGLFMALFFGGIVLRFTNNWYFSYMTAATVSLLLLLLSLPWITASIRGVPIYSNVPTTYGGGSMEGSRGPLSYGSLWWFNALSQSLKTKI